MSTLENENWFNRYFGNKEDFTDASNYDESSQNSNYQLSMFDSSIDRCSEDELDVDFEEDKTLDRQYLAALEGLSNKIIFYLHQTREKKLSTERRLRHLAETKEKPQPRKNWYHLFGSPYFKDKTFYPCPGNEDFYEKLEKNEINYHELPPVRRWKACDQQRLEEAVRSNLVEIRKKELKIAKDTIVKKLKADILTSYYHDELQLEVQNLDQEILEVENKAIEDLLERNCKEIDWLRISAVNFDGQRTSEELKAMWDYCLQPCISKRNWSQQENKRLAEIAERHNLEDWDKIAKELGTKRSGFQCFVQYQRFLNRNLKKSKWTKEEDNNLKKIIQECRVGDFIPWSKVALQMNGRTKVQVYNRWTYSIDPMIRKGRFTPEEDCLIVAGVQRFGKDFPRISRFLPGRTSIQIRDRFIGSLQKVGPISKWTKEEDQLLLKLVAKLGTKSWSRISSHFRDRYRCQVRHRYLTLKKWLAKFPDISQEHAPRKYVGDYCNLQTNLWSRVQSILKSSLKIKERQRDKKMSREEEILSLKRKLNMVNSKRSGRKSGSSKQLTSADILLSKCLMNLMDDEDIEDETKEQVQKQKEIISLLLQILKGQLNFSSLEKITEEDKWFKSSDKKILRALKIEYDEKNKKSVCKKMSIKHPRNVPSETFQTTASKFNNAEDVNNTKYPLTESTELELPYYLPPSKGTIRGVVMWSNVDFKFYSQFRNIEKKSSEKPNRNIQHLSPEVSKKLFKERLDVIFGWTMKLKGCKPPITEDVFGLGIDNSSEQIELQSCQNDEIRSNSGKDKLSKQKKYCTRTGGRKKCKNYQTKTLRPAILSPIRKRKSTKNTEVIKKNTKSQDKQKIPQRRSARIAELEKKHM